MRRDRTWQNGSYIMRYLFNLEIQPVQALCCIFDWKCKMATVQDNFNIEENKWNNVSQKQENKLNTGNTWIIIGWSLPKLCLCGLEKMATTPWHCIVYDITYWSEWVSEWFLFNANSAIFQLYHGENKLIFNEMIMMSTLY